METKELIGNEIVEIRCKILQVEYEGNIPLEEIDVEIKLSNGKIISFPYPESIIIESEDFNPKLNRIILPTSIISKLLNKPNAFEAIKGEKIIGIWLTDDDFGEELCAIEFSNGYFLTKGLMSPIGTGNADLFLFESKNEIETRYGAIRKASI